MVIRIRGAREHNLKSVNVDIGDGLTAVTGVSGSGKSSLVFDTLYHEARRRFLDVYTNGAPLSRLIPAEVDTITGLGPAVSVGQNLLNRNPASTLASASGLHPFFRLLFARFGERICPACGAKYSVLGRDDVVQRIVNAFQRAAGEIEIPLLTGSAGSHAALLRMLPPVLADIGIVYADGQIACHPLDPLRPHDLSIRLHRSGREWNSQWVRTILNEAEAMGVYAIRVSEENGWIRLGWEPECGSCGRWFPEIRPQDFHRVCAICHGDGCDACHCSGLPADAAVVTWGGVTFKELLHLSVEDSSTLLERSELPSERVRIEIRRRLEALIQVGLGYLTLDRPAPTLSRGESQRVRLATTITNRLSDLVHILDEPTVGLHPVDVERLVPVFRGLNGPVIYVEHDRSVVADADEVIDIGPGAGIGGGSVTFQGSPKDLWEAETLTGQWFSLRRGPINKRSRPDPDKFLTITAASANNLQNIDVAIPLGRMTVVTGVSGSGKSTLVEDVLAASLRDKKPIGCEKLSSWLDCELVDQSPIGKNPRSNPATYTKLADIVRGFYATVSGLSPSHFSFNRPEGACPACQGLGAIEVTMRYLPSSWMRCETCEGRRFTDLVLTHSIQSGGVSYSVADFYNLPIGEVHSFIETVEGLGDKEREAALRILDALCRIGLAYLPLGQPSTSLSGGEAQRVKLARYLGMKSLAGKILIMDEPSTGLHSHDLAGLLDVFNRLTEAGATLVVVEHHLDVIRSADWVIDLGPGAGSKGGNLVFMGPPAQLIKAAGSQTGAALRREADLVPRARREKPVENSAGDSICINGARANNLRNIVVKIPKGKLTVVTGVSGSGKSSLVVEILEGEARRRFYETLSMYERQGVHEGREAEVDQVTGLGVTLRAAPEKLMYSRRATVGSLTEISHHLAILFALRGGRTCLECGMEMTRTQAHWLCPQCGTRALLPTPGHFLGNSYAAACLVCHGVGSFQQPNPAKLIIAPDKPLCAGAMYSPGFFPNGYLGKPGNGGYYLVQALGRRYAFDPHRTPWDEMTEEAKQVFLFGGDELLDVQGTSKSGRTIDHQARFPGFYRFIGDWDVGNTYTDNVTCPECGGARLRREYLAVRLGGTHVADMSRLSLRDLHSCLVEMARDFDRSTAQFSYQAVIKRLDFLCQVGLGYLSLVRPAGTLSAGEVQRLRLAGLLGSQLTSLTILLDEPTRGLHPVEVGALQQALHALSEAGNTVVVVEHDEAIIRGADHLIDMGPGAGEHGGMVVAEGSPDWVAKSGSVTAAWLRGERNVFLPSERRSPSSWMVLRGARGNNLRNITVQFPLGVLCGVCGVSGSGKSSLVIDTLGRILSPVKQSTSMAYEPLEPGDYDFLDGAPARTLIVDQSRSGMSSPAVWLGVSDPIYRLFLESEEARQMGFLHEEVPLCSTCSGRGYTTLDLAFLPDFTESCDECGGSGWSSEADLIYVNGVALSAVMDMTIERTLERFDAEDAIARPLRAAMDVGLGYLVLRQPGYSLSGGEVQRLKIAQELARKKTRGTLYIFDEPTVGQHMDDVHRLCVVLHHLAASGASVLVVEHHPHLLAACDWLVEMGPGGGLDGGAVIMAGTPEAVAIGSTPMAPYLNEILKKRI